MEVDTRALLRLLGDEIRTLRESNDGLDEALLEEMTAATKDDLLKDQLWGWPLEIAPLDIESFFAHEWSGLTPEARAFVAAGVRALQRLHEEHGSPENPRAATSF